MNQEDPLPEIDIKHEEQRNQYVLQQYKKRIDYY